MNFATEVTIRSALAMSREELGAQIKAKEVMMGFSIIEEARWLDPDDWDRWTIVSQDGKRIRLVSLSARNPYTGAFTKLVNNILAEGMCPVVVSPNDFLTLWCKKHWYRKRNCGRGNCRHEVWYPKRCHY